jgi:predicted Rossmann fold nucleotide-binding protein DprA/Smf involved in DNA uptake
MMWPLLDKTKEIQTALFVDLSPTEQKAVDLIRKHSELSVDQIAGFLGTTPSETASILLQLEFHGLIRNIPGKRYIMV